MPHHLRRTDDAAFRDGCTVDKPPGYKPVFGRKLGTFVDVGLGEPVKVADTVDIGSRVTVRMMTERELRTSARFSFPL